jgi:hypothetical protein
MLLILKYTNCHLGLEFNKSFVWDPVFRRLRCNGHIINLSAQSFLFPNLPDKDNVVVLDAVASSAAISTSILTSFRTIVDLMKQCCIVLGVTQLCQATRVQPIALRRFTVLFGSFPFVSCCRIY